MVVRWLREQTPQSLAVYAFSFILGALKKVCYSTFVSISSTRPMLILRRSMV
jgi:hypothetical protein